MENKKKYETKLTNKEEQVELLHTLWKEDKKMSTLIGAMIGFFAISTWFCFIYFLVLGFNIGGCLCMLFCAMFFSWPTLVILIQQLKTSKLIKNDVFSYHYVPIDRYSPSRYTYDIHFTINNKKYSHSTDIYGGEFVHVFLLGDNELIKVVGGKESNPNIMC